MKSKERTEKRTETHACDLISRQAALDAMETWDKFGCDPDGKLVRYDDDKHYIPYVHYEDMVHAIKHLPSAQPEQHLCRDCKWAKYYGNVDKNGNVESYWYCTNWYGGTDEEGYCHEWESR